MECIAEELCSFYLIIRLVVSEVVQTHSYIVICLVDHVRDCTDIRVVTMIEQVIIKLFLLLD